MKLLKQSTAVDIPLGPFVDSADGVTPETGLTLSQADVRLKKNGGAWAQKNQTSAATHEENGNYEVNLNSTDTDTLGILRVFVNEAGALPVWDDYLVVPANVYDSLVGGSDKLQVHADEITNGLITAAAIADGAIDAGAIADNAITAAKLAANCISDDQLHVNAVNEIRNAVTGGAYALSTDANGHVRVVDGTGAGELDTSSGKVSIVSADITSIQSGLATAANLATVAGYIDTEVATLLSRLGTPSDLGSGASVAANLVDIEAQTDDIGVAGAGLSAVPWNAAWDAEVQSECNDAIVANNLDHLVLAAVDTDFATTVHANSVVGHLADNGVGFDRTTDSLEAIRDRGDAAWTGGGGGVADWTADERTAIRSILGIPASGTTPDDPTVGVLDTIRDLIDTEVGAIKTKTDQLTFTVANRVDSTTQSGVSTLTSADVRTAVGLASANLDTQLGQKPTLAQILAGGDVDGYTVEQTFKILLAALAGKVSGAGTTTITFRAADDSKDRIVATVTESGNRTAITLDATG